MSHRRNHEQAREKFNIAYDAHLEVMADNTLRIYEKLLAERDAARKTYFKQMRAWRKACSKLSDEEQRPVAPTYEGPEEWELSNGREACEGAFLASRKAPRES